MSCDVCRGTNSSRCPVCGGHSEPGPCPECRGIGLVNCYALSMKTGEEIEVTAETFLCLPETEEEARRAGRYYYRAYSEGCRRCDGTGEI